MAMANTFAVGLGPHSSFMDFAVHATVPPGVPQALVPIVKVIQGIFLRYHGKDPYPMVSKSVVALGALYGLKKLWDYVQPHIITTLTSSVTLSANHSSAINIRYWLSQQDARTLGTAARHMRLKDSAANVDVTRGDIKFSFDTETSLTTSWLVYKGHILIFQQKKSEIRQIEDSRRRYVSEEQRQSMDQLKVISLGWSRVLEEFMKEASDYRIKATSFAMTLVGHPMLPEHFSLPADWTFEAHTSRPMDTVELDPVIKADILNDIAQFIEPNRDKFYQRRGIRYKRGYLLFGPPGTGKSSFALACAGITGGKLYEVTLGQILSESLLQPLFRKPGKGDILLLEDIDTANIKRESMAKVDKKDSLRVQQNPVSLAGLLSAIDSIPDGVILIMTTNSPESLDEALIRSGRVDKRVHFGYANSTVVRSIFTRIYKDDKDNTTLSEINELSRRFAEKVPLDSLTPAELQGFLLEKSNPQAALEEIDDWIRDLVEAREKRKKHVEIQKKRSIE